MISRAVVIGTGMMGPGIAATLALGGVAAVVTGRTAESADRGAAAARDALNLLADHQIISADLRQQALGLISASGDLEKAAADADLVIESAPENMELKQDLFCRLEELTGPNAILTSNTSGLSITSIAERCVRPERVVTTHFINPPHLIPLVEIVKGVKTAEETVTALQELFLRCGKVPVVVKKDTPGQLLNRIQFAMVREAIHIVEEGIASPEDVDSILKNALGLRLPVYGLFDHIDSVGLDMCLSIASYVMPHLNSEPAAPQMLQDLVAAGNLGAKTGSGFYDWSKRDNKAVKAGLHEFLLAMLQRRAKQQTA